MFPLAIDIGERYGHSGLFFTSGFSCLSAFIPLTILSHLCSRGYFAKLSGTVIPAYSSPLILPYFFSTSPSSIFQSRRPFRIPRLQMSGTVIPAYSSSAFYFRPHASSPLFYLSFEFNLLTFSSSASFFSLLYPTRPQSKVTDAMEVQSDWRCRRHGNALRCALAPGTDNLQRCWCCS